MPSRRMSNILTHQVRVALATSDAQNILEIRATDEINMEDRNHGLAWTKPNNGIYNTQHGQLARNELNLNPALLKRSKEK